MLDFVKLILLRNDVGQIVDGLTERMLVWRATAEYFETGYPQSADYIEECSDEDEATAIADHYQYVIQQIKRQLNEQQKGDSLFIHLFHGRKDFNSKMDDSDFDGPIFGPYSGIHGVYCNIHLRNANGDLDYLHVFKDHIYYDGCYYGDWGILTEPSTIEKMSLFQQDKADIQKTKIDEEGS